MMPRSPVLWTLLIAVLGALSTAVSAVGVGAQSPDGLEVRVLPAANFDSDEGFGYGGFAQIHQYGQGLLRPYLWTVQPAAFFTSKGRRDLVVFFDAPHILPGGWRVTAFLGSERQVATPFYGLGNQSLYDPTLSLADGANPRFYRFGVTRHSATVTLQKGIGATPLAFLVGGGVENTSVVAVPDESETTLYAENFSAGNRTLASTFVRGGLVWDTRDRETGPRSGGWTDFLVHWVDESLGADFEATRWTFTDRRYVSLAEGVVFAHRYLLRNVSVGAPPSELFRIQTSFKQEEGLGGARTVRGLLKNRFVGRGMLVWNAEVRWRVGEFSVVGRRFHAVLSAFVDQGRVWEDGIDLSAVFSDLHRGYGGGVRIGLGEDFIVAVDVATSRETTLPFYLGLGYLY